MFRFCTFRELIIDIPLIEIGLELKRKPRFDMVSVIFMSLRKLMTEIRKKN